MGRHGTAHDKNKSGKFHSTMGAVRRLPGFAKLNRHGVSDLVKLRQHLMDESPTAEGERCSTQLPAWLRFKHCMAAAGRQRWPACRPHQVAQETATRACE